MMRCAIWYHLYNLRNVKNTHGGVLLSVKLQVKACNFTVTLFHGCFSRFLNCKNGTKTRKAIYYHQHYFHCHYYFNVNVGNINKWYWFKSSLIILVIITVRWFDGFHFRTTLFNSFHSTSLFLYPLKMSEKQTIW